jgi:hypothetical protein
LVLRAEADDRAAAEAAERREEHQRRLEEQQTRARKIRIEAARAVTSRRFARRSLNSLRRISSASRNGATGRWTGLSERTPRSHQIAYEGSTMRTTSTIRSPVHSDAETGEPQAPPARVVTPADLAGPGGACPGGYARRPLQ